jgi:hypothetical protein
LARTTKERETPLVPLGIGEYRGSPLLTSETLAHMQRGRDELARRRSAACVRIIVEKRRPRATIEDPRDRAGSPGQATGEVNCATCGHLVGFNAEHERGFCSWLRVQRSTWHPIICKAFKLAA